MVQGGSVKKRLLMGFQDGCENYLNSDQLTDVIAEKIPMEEEPQVPTIYVIPDEKFPSEKGYYYGVYVMLHFNKEEGVNMKEYQADVRTDPDAEETEDSKLDEK